MKSILKNCQANQELLNERMQELLEQQRAPQLTSAQVQALEARRKLLNEEACELRRIIEMIQPYLNRTGRMDKAGDASCV